MRYEILPSENYLYAENKEIETEQSGRQDIINQILGNKIEILQRILVDISSEITNRKKLSITLVKTIETRQLEYSADLYTLDFWPMGTNRHIDIRRNEIEKRIHQLEKEKRDRETERWQDIAVLKKEFRSTYKEYNDVLRRFNVIRDGNNLDN